MIDQAIQLAAVGHEGQTDKAGQPYVLHPLRVMIALQKAGEDEQTQAIGVLHDLFEDTDVGPNAMANTVPEGVITGVKVLTKGPGETYPEYVDRIIRLDRELEYDGRLIRVKLADLADNLDPARAATLPEEKGALYREAQFTLGANQ